MSESYTRVFPIFAAAFAVIYLLAEQNNWALLTYHPRVGDWEFLVKPARDARSPAMYWYGWLVTSFLGASAVSLAALPLTKGRGSLVFLGWAIPLAVMVLFVYLFRGFFIPR